MLKLVLSLVAAELNRKTPLPPRQRRHGLGTKHEIVRVCDGAAGQAMPSDSPLLLGGQSR